MASFVELPCEDVTFAHIFPNLNLKDLFRLRSASRDIRILVDAYFTKWQTLDLSDDPHIGSVAFKVRFSSLNNNELGMDIRYHLHEYLLGC